MASLLWQSPLSVPQILLVQGAHQDLSEKAEFLIIVQELNVLILKYLMNERCLTASNNQRAVQAWG